MFKYKIYHVLLEKNIINFLYNRLFCWNHACWYGLCDVSVTLCRSLLYIQGLITRNSTVLVNVVPIGAGWCGVTKANHISIIVKQLFHRNVPILSKKMIPHIWHCNSLIRYLYWRIKPWAGKTWYKAEIILFHWWSYFISERITFEINVSDVAVFLYEKVMINIFSNLVARKHIFSVDSE